MRWTALVALKPAANRKTRLAKLLDPSQRAALTDDLLDLACAALDRSRHVSRAVLVSRDIEPRWRGDWLPDAGRGLNAALTEARGVIGRGPLLVILPDLPLVTQRDVDALIEAAATCGAIAPDRHGTGTNAIAIPDGMPFSFKFGPNSLREHRAAHPALRIVSRPGLGLDVDTPSDLALAVGRGFCRRSIDLRSESPTTTARFAASPPHYCLEAGST